MAPFASRMLLGVAVALALTGSAQAANSQATGALKKQAAAAARVPRGQLKKLAQAHPVGGGARGSHVRKQAQASHAPRRATTRIPRAVAVRSAPRPRPHPASIVRTHPRAVARTRAAVAAATTHPRRSRLHPAHAVVRPRTRRPAPTRHAPAPALKRPSDAAPLRSLSNAAVRVVEVIPGAILLALGGLTALVLLLVVRSCVTERRRARALATSYRVTVEALATAIEAKDETTGGHIERVRRLGLLLASRMVPREARDPQMAYGFLLHDIGKLAVPDAILRAPGHLADHEWLLMRRHPEEGVRMLGSVPFLDKALDVVRHHHERWDGGGYPDGLCAEQIPLWARIFAVVDALDAMTAKRPYRRARSYESALAEIRAHSGTQFDPAVVDALERLDPAEVAPLLERTHQVQAASEPLAELAQAEPLAVV